MNVLITGGASGLGKELCKSFKENGYNVFYTYNTSIKDDDLGTGIKCDLNNEDEINNMLSKLDNIDVLINNAAVEIDKEFNEKTKEDFMHTLSVNLVAPFLISRYIGNKMKETSGVIINISSNNAIDMYDPITLEYDASKAGLINLSHNLAKALAPNVRVNTILPGWIKTNKIIELDNSLNNEFIKEESKKILLNRFAEPNDICNLALFLASDKANYINDAVIRIDGGINGR